MNPSPVLPATRRGSHGELVRAVAWLEKTDFQCKVVVAERNRAMGCKGLQQALRRVRPRLSVCGHVHEGRGAEWVRWNSEDGAIVERWDDPGSGKGNKKISLISPTARAGKQSLKASGVAAGGNGGGWDTCIVNGAIAATNYPHIGGKRFNKPIVVDLELPVWRESTE
ncbi:hypothetical protein SBRCBS47491_008313 [Sporothrix bragantina]|uniref:Uncharacterized protein n=1 Tax=Sporothrix bragantina TaxID=671064 RepID=A0ABP0CMZ0_9PEZI